MTYFAEQLWDADVCRLIPGIDYVLDSHRDASPSTESDNTKSPLFVKVKETTFMKATYQGMLSVVNRLWAMHNVRLLIH